MSLTVVCHGSVFSSYFLFPPIATLVTLLLMFTQQCITSNFSLWNFDGMFKITMS